MRISTTGQIFIPDKICFSTLLGGQMLLSSPVEGFTAFLKKLFPAQYDAEKINLKIAGITVSRRQAPLQLS
ncbi:hypothetical protein [Methylicorpusculum sp.]|uniref:hypothetical protein n=1 Tax=Methylicorpusculum sp. TaxID=2713644 RepID=UPI00272F731F|nr:hypothetical protein [Methylicorpusculum sp.]MDP2177696.1 hypothetical protein [Methylicorpusculum sp.]MDP3528335.1 hypothetical protein [Methylicorpusculum sp.]